MFCCGGRVIIFAVMFFLCLPESKIVLYGFVVVMPVLIYIFLLFSPFAMLTNSMFK